MLNIFHLRKINDNWNLIDSFQKETLLAASDFESVKLIGMAKCQELPCALLRVFSDPDKVDDIQEAISGELESRGSSHNIPTDAHCIEIKYRANLWQVESEGDETRSFKYREGAIEFARELLETREKSIVCVYKAPYHPLFTYEYHAGEKALHPGQYKWQESEEFLND